MFTGIIEQQGIILDIHEGVFVIENPFSEPITKGQSIAHDGACMTITDIGNSFLDSGKKRYSFFVMEESFSKTNLETKKIGDYFNIERSMIYGQRVDGHIVSGHIDTTAIVSHINKNLDNSWNLEVSLDLQRNNNMIEKGSIAINGVSLTIVSIKTQEKKSVIVTVCLIPYTREHSNLSRLSLGDRVNIEFDMMGKYILNAHSLISNA